MQYTNNEVIDLILNNKVVEESRLPTTLYIEKDYDFTNASFKLIPNITCLRINCNETVNFSTLSNIKYLYLSGLVNGDTPNPKLCTFNLAGLSNVHVLHIDYSDITGFGSIKNIDYVLLKDCNNVEPDTSQTVNVKHAYIRYCNFTDVSAFANVNSLKILDCPNITDVSCFKNTQHLMIHSCNAITNFFSLKNNNCLAISCCDKINSISCFENVKYLEIAHCRNFTDVSMIKNIKRLSIKNCPHITNVSMIENVDYIELFRSKSCCETLLNNKQFSSFVADESIMKYDLDHEWHFKCFCKS